MNEMLPWSEDKATFPAQVFEMELNQASLPDNQVDVEQITSVWKSTKYHLVGSSFHW
jgi:hypothetical protein